MAAKTSFWIGWISSRRFFHQRALLPEEALLILLGLLLLRENRLLDRIAHRRRERSPLRHVVVVDLLDLLEPLVHVGLVLFGERVQIGDRLVVGVDRLEDLFAVHDYVVLCRQRSGRQMSAANKISRFMALVRLVIVSRHAHGAHCFRKYNSFLSILLPRRRF